MYEMVNTDEEQSITPIVDVLPELSADDYADVRQWDAARMRLAEGYERSDGEYLAKIQAKLAPVGLFGAYLKARGIPTATAQQRIARSQGRHINRGVMHSITPSLVEPEPEETEEDEPAWEPPLTYVPRIEMPAPEPIQMPDIPQRPQSLIPPRLAPLMTSATPEWYTPPDLLAEIRMFLGDIDLDPCPPAHTTPDAPDGLAITWTGRVFCNPPYGDVIGDWVRKAAQSAREGTMTECILLVPARTDTQWFQSLWDCAVCFLRGRLHFSRPDGSMGPAPFPSVLAYYGPSVDEFAAAFSHRGVTVKAVQGNVEEPIEGMD